VGDYYGTVCHPAASLIVSRCGIKRGFCGTACRFGFDVPAAREEVSHGAHGEHGEKEEEGRRLGG